MLINRFQSGDFDATPHITVNKYTPVQVLETIKTGDYMEDHLGNKGIVTCIDIKKRGKETHYYFSLMEAKTILLIK